MAKVKRQARSDDTRAAIMEAGTYLFGTKGFGETGIRDIAQRADVNPALISYHFGGKEGLFEKIFAEAIEADAYCRDAAVAVETAKKFMAIRRAKA